MRRRRQHGFTLVEMLVALSIASLLLVLVYGAVRVGQRSVSAIESQVDRSESIRISWQFLHRALSEAVPMPNPDADEDEDFTSFIGTADSLVFVADAPPYVGLGGLMKYSLEVEEGVDGARLRLTRQRYDDEGASIDSPIEDAVLVEALDNIQISYFGYTADSETAEWHAEWQEPESLPRLVQVQILPADGMPWPTLIARPLSSSQAFGEDGIPIDSEPDLEAEPGQDSSRDFSRGAPSFDAAPLRDPETGFER